MSEETTPEPRALTGGGAIVRFFKRLQGALYETVLPAPHYLQGEEVQLVIHMADYRQVASQIMLRVGLVLVGVAAPLTLIFWLLQVETLVEYITGLLALLGLLLLVQGGQGWLTYRQWQFILTNKRIIITTPDPKRSLRADVVYLKGGKIQVLDTNFSKNPLWGLLQMLTGARDVVLSMSGYEFKEVGAEVKGGLRFPDVTPEDIARLEELIFK